MNKNIKIIKYLFSDDCSDITSKKLAYKYQKEYLSDLSQKIPSSIYSIYDELGLIPDEYNWYEEFIDILIKNFDINCNILEVAGGNIPRLATRLSKRQYHLSSDTITVIDPSLAINPLNYPKLKLHKETFDLDTDIYKYDLIISLFPCEATEIILCKALEQNKDFFIRLCDCIHKFEEMDKIEYLYWIKNPNDYRKMLINKYKEYANYFERKIEVINNHPDSPIIMCKKK